MIDIIVDAHNSIQDDAIKKYGYLFSKKKFYSEISQDFEFIDKTDAYVGKGYTIKVNLGGDEYKVAPRKERMNFEGNYSYSTYVIPPYGEEVRIDGKGFTKKLIDLLDKSV